MLPIAASFTDVELWKFLQIIKQDVGLRKMQHQHYPRNQTKRDGFCDRKMLLKSLFFFFLEKNVKEVRNGIRVQS